MLSFTTKSIMLSVVMLMVSHHNDYHYAEWHNIKCSQHTDYHYAESRNSECSYANGPYC